jgi:hypothetical protein
LEIVQGDLVAILMWGFFLNSSRKFKDFGKNIICHAMKCNPSKLFLVNALSWQILEI